MFKATVASIFLCCTLVAGEIVDGWRDERPRPPVCWYDPPPFDVQALGGAEAPAFSDFPYTEV